MTFNSLNNYLMPPIQCKGNVHELPCVLATGNVVEISYVCTYKPQEMRMKLSPI